MTSPGNGSLDARLEVDGSSLGFAPPPFAIEMRPEAVTEGWSAILSQTHGRLGEIVTWAEPLRPRRILMGDGDAARLDVDVVPDAWRWMPRDVKVDRLLLDPGGGAVVHLRGRATSVQRFADQLREGGARVEARPIGARSRRLLTVGQEEALRVAVAEGYYLVPRALNLQALATKLGVSPASLSERLRRAEGRVLTKFVESGILFGGEPMGGASAPNL